MLTDKCYMAFEFRLTAHYCFSSTNIITFLILAMGQA